MAYILNDPTIFSIYELVASDIYQLSVGNEIFRGDFLPIRWILSKDSSQDIGDYFLMTAVNFGQLSVLQYLHEKGYVWDEGTCAKAAENGHLDCLIYLHEQGCPWDRRTCMYAARNGHLDCLRYAFDHGCPYDIEICKAVAIKYKRDRCLQYIMDVGR